jgi:RHS repeat-associated protein
MTTSSVGNRFLFAGAILLPEASLYDMRNRVYFPRWGRFLQTDPIGFQGDASNLYRYCGNDPVDKSDPEGLYETPLGGWDVINGGKPASYYIDAYHAQTQNQPAGNITIALESPAEGKKGQLNVENKPMRFVPTHLANDGKTVLPSSQNHSGGDDEYQFSDAQGHRRSGVGLTVLEKLKTVKGEDVGKVQKIQAPLQNNGIFPDHVGSDRRPSSVDNGRISVAHQTFEVRQANGQLIPVSTVMGHSVRFINGQVVPYVWVIKP